MSEGLRIRCRFPQSSRFSLDVDLQLPGTGVCVIFGPSGAGKTTLLRCVAGLDAAAEADISINGEIWQSANGRLPAHRRDVGYVFQRASLLPHLSAARNIAFAVRRAISSPLDDAARERLVALLNIEHLLQQSPASLSGGERQRVALACALVRNPRLLLMDEPLNGLDAARKAEIMRHIRALRDTYTLPMLYVTHDVDEVAQLADHMVVLKDGSVAYEGNVFDVFAALGPPFQMPEEQGVVVDAVVGATDITWALTTVAFQGGSMRVSTLPQAPGTRVRIRILARDVSLTLRDTQGSSILNRLPVRVERIVPEPGGSTCMVTLRCGSQMFLSRITRYSAVEMALQGGQQVWMQIKSASVVHGP